MVAGIDEAGFGPVLGPLVVSAAMFDVPDELVGVSLWDLLSAAVSRRASKAHRKLAIADSKRLYNRRKPDALANVERGVLAMLAAAGHGPGTFGALMRLVAPGCGEHVGGYPWYGQVELPLPRSAGATDAALLGNAVSVAMRQAGVGFRGFRCEPVFAGEYNRMVGATDNKSMTLLSVTSRLIMHAWTQSAGGLVRMYVDRQGGRMRYLTHLQRIFPGCRFRVLDESDAVSAYAVSDDRRTAEIHFTVKSDELHLPAALASMACKYVREVFMEMFNAFWRTHVPELADTAGYYTDGNRFFEDIRPAVLKLGIDEGLIYRSR